MPFMHDDVVCCCVAANIRHDEGSGAVRVLLRVEETSKQAKSSLALCEVTREAVIIVVHTYKSCL